MNLDIHVGKSRLVIHQGEAVWLAEPDGQVAPDSERGLLFRDTRLISVWQLFANGAAWERLSGGAPNHFMMQAFLSNPAIPTEDNAEIRARALLLELSRWLEGGVHEDLDIVNNGPVRARFNLELVLRSDVADLFEVKSHRLVRRGRIVTEWSEADQQLRSLYRNGDFMRGLTLTARGDTQAVMANGRLSFEVDLQPGEAWHACLLTDLHDGAETLKAPEGHASTSGVSVSSEALATWRDGATRLHTPNEEFYRFYHQGVDDLAALRLPWTRKGEVSVVPAAGLPWFAALFGRDSLIVALQCAPVTLQFARGALDLLGDWQATERDDSRDAEPGKILHELRRGELAHFKLIPHTPYYGTADATPLYLVLLHAAWRWTGERALLERHLDTAERCLDWIDTCGDRDGDLFQEYQTRAPRGYENMAWKDAGDAVPYPDGTLVRGPKALCELQGYVYAAWTGMAEIYAALGQEDRAAELRVKAVALLQKFNDVFWDEEWGGYVYALDGEKQPVKTSVSNVGHLLWSGIVPPERAARVVARLMAPDMFSGWGIRTLSTAASAVQPARLPQRLGVAARQRADRAGICPLRVPRGGGAGGARGQRRRDVFRAAPDPGAVCRAAARGGAVPGAGARRQRAAGLGGGLGVFVSPGVARDRGGCAEQRAAARAGAAGVAARGNAARPVHGRTDVRPAFRPRRGRDAGRRAAWGCGGGAGGGLKRLSRRRHAAASAQASRPS